MVQYCIHCYDKIRGWLLVPALAVALLSLLLVRVSAEASAFGDPSTDAPRPLILTDGQGQYPLGQHLQILDDPSGKLSIQDVSSPAYAAKFIASQAPVPNFGYTDHVYWLRLDLANETSATHQWFLESSFPNLNYVDLYLPSEAGGFIRKGTGALLPMESTSCKVVVVTGGAFISGRVKILTRVNDPGCRTT